MNSFAIPEQKRTRENLVGEQPHLLLTSGRGDFEPNVSHFVFTHKLSTMDFGRLVMMNGFRIPRPHFWFVTRLFLTS